MPRIVLALLFVLGVVFCSACGPTQEPARMSTALGPDGYALFKAQHEGGSRLAFFVELRDVPDGTYVLLHTKKAPSSTGWFELDPSDYAACKRYGTEAVDERTLDCMLPDGHGDLVDVVEVSAATSASSRAVLRHQIDAPTFSSSSSCTRDCSSTATLAGYYAIMRVERDGQIAPIAVEVRSLEDDAWKSPTVERLE